MVEIAASFQQSFESVFMSAGERLGKLKARLSELNSASKEVSGLRSLQAETGRLNARLAEASARIPGLKAAHEAAARAQADQKRKTLELSAEAQKHLGILKESKTRYSDLKAEISSSNKVLSDRKSELKASRAEQRSLETAHRQAWEALGKLTEEEKTNAALLDRGSSAAAEHAQRIAAVRGEIGRLTAARTEEKKRSEALLQEIKAHDAALAGQKDRLATLRTEQEKCVEAHRSAQAALKSHTSVLKAEHAELSKNGQSLKDHEEALSRAEAELKDATNALDAQTIALKRHEDALQAAGYEVKDLTKLENQLAAASARAQRSHDLAARGKRLNDRGRELRSDITGGAFEVAGMAIALGAPVKIAAEFEHAMAKVGAQTMASTEELKMLEAEARKLGDSTVFSSSDAASAQSFLAQAGFGIQDIADSLKGVLDLAAAGGTDLGETAEMASNMLAGFSLDATDMVRVANAMTATFVSSNTDLRDLAETMKYVAPVASGLGASIEEVAAASGLLGNVGLQGSMAGTALRAMYQRLASPPAAGREALEKLGIATRDAHKNLLPLPEVLEKLDRKMAKMGTAERAKYIKDIFGEEAAAGATELLDKAGAGQLEFEIKKLQLAPAFRQSLKYVQDNMTSDDLKGLEQRFGIAFKDGAKSANVAEFAKAFEGLKGADFEKRFAEIFKIKPTIDKTELDLESDAAKSKLKSLKISEVGANKKQKSNDELTKEIESALAGLPEPERLQAISILFSRSRNELSALMEEAAQGSDKFRSLTDALEKTNSAEEISNRLNSTTVGAWKTLQSALEAAAISAGAVFLPALSEVMKTIADAMRSVSGFATEHQQLVKWIGYIAAGLVLAKGAVLGYKAALWVLNGALQIITIAQKAWNLVASKNPVALIILAAAALAPLAIAVYKNWDGIMGYVKEKWTQLKAIFKAVWKVIEPVAQFTPLGVIIKNWDPIVGFFTRLYERLKPIFQSIGKFFGLGDTIGTSVPEGMLIPAGFGNSTRLPEITSTRMQAVSSNRQQNYHINQRFDIAVEGGDSAPKETMQKIKSQMVDGFNPANFSFADTLGF
jgi:TP901 family phage tail tape measure protein